MKGIVLAGGLGTRLRPLTTVVNKHLLPVFDRPMIFYALQSLADAGIEDVMVVVGGQSTEAIMKLCKDGRTFGFRRLYYVYQEGEGGIAAALALTEQFAAGDDICVVLGDNILLGEKLNRHRCFRGAKILVKEVANPQDYGVADFDDEGRVASIIEKPILPLSNWAVIGVYFYDKTVFDKIRTCKPSGRGELEITDVNNCYIAEGRLDAGFVKGLCIDAGYSIEGWLAAGRQVEEFFTREKEGTAA